MWELRFHGLVAGYCCTLDVAVPSFDRDGRLPPSLRRSSMHLVPERCCRAGFGYVQWDFYFL